MAPPERSRTSPPPRSGPPPAPLAASPSPEAEPTLATAAGPEDRQAASRTEAVPDLTAPPLATVHPAFRPLVPGEVLDARAEARAILAAAEAQARHIRDAAEAEVAQAVAEATRAAEARLAAAAAQRLREVERLAELRRLAWEQAVARAALAVAEQVWGRVEVDTAEAAQAAAWALAEEIEAAPGVRLRVHPDDAPFVEVGLIPVVGDGSLEPGDAVLETEDGLRDARVRTRLSIALDALAAALGLARVPNEASPEAGGARAEAPAERRGAAEGTP
ncbi:MAG: hypothetical protein D6729_12920 [Deltaproteobacteria bacterium]|nr:MAG: hypothetical protein D6729_12920 [Deltaproteobacteria bacterium]